MNPLYIGIDIGGTRTKIGLVDIQQGKVLEVIINPTQKKDADLFLAMIRTMVYELKKMAINQGRQIAGIGIGVPSFVFPDGLVDSTYGFLEFMEDFPLGKLIEKQNDIPCRVDNDARVVALGEALYGRGKEYQRVLVLTLGTGLGIGLVVNRKFESSLPYSHMGGHLTISDSSVKCYCGKTGCLEALVSTGGILQAAKRIGWGNKHSDEGLTVQAIFESEQKGDPNASIIINEFLTHLRKGVDNYINLFAPDLIVIGGGIAKGMKIYESRLSDTSILRPNKNYKVAITISELEESAGILGAAALFY